MSLPVREARTAEIVLAWDPSGDSVVTGYRLYWAVDRQQYSLLADVGKSTEAVVSNLIDGITYFFVATAYDNYGNESAYSNEISYGPPGAPSYYSAVQELYIAVYHRPADPAGLVYWAEILRESSGNPFTVIDAFGNSREFQSLFGTVNKDNIHAVVNAAYNAFFNRNAEREGLDYYVNKFNTGKYTPAGIMLDIFQHAQNEDLRAINNKLAAANLFTECLDLRINGSVADPALRSEAYAAWGRAFLTLVSSDPASIPTRETATAYIINAADHPDSPPVN